jgi:CheY-like chemotaxis protein
MRKIISSGQTGVEMAALDVAAHLGISLGGTAPRGLRNDNGPIPVTYGLEEAPVLGFKHAMEQNVIHADGTLLVTKGDKCAASRFAVETSLKLQRQLLHIDLSQHSGFEAASLISSWLKMQSIQVIFVTGSTEAQDKTIYSQVKKILETAFYLEFVKTGLHPTLARPLTKTSEDPDERYPTSVEEAVTRLKSALPLKDRTLMANMQADELDRLRSGLGEFIKQNFGLYAGNEALLESCADRGTLLRPIPEEACAVILRALWEDLHATHRLRIIK